MNKRILLGLVLTLLVLQVIAENANAKPDTSQVATAPSGSGDLSVGQIIALAVSAAVALVGLWLYFRPKSKNEKINKTALASRRLYFA